MKTRPLSVNTSYIENSISRKSRNVWDLCSVTHLFLWRGASSRCERGSLSRPAAESDPTPQEVSGRDSRWPADHVYCCPRGTRHLSLNRYGIQMLRWDSTIFRLCPDYKFDFFEKYSHRSNRCSGWSLQLPSVGSHDLTLQIRKCYRYMTKLNISFHRHSWGKVINRSKILCIWCCEVDLALRASVCVNVTRDKAGLFRGQMRRNRLGTQHSLSVTRQASSPLINTTWSFRHTHTHTYTKTHN